MTPDQEHFEAVLEGISRGSTSDIKVLLASLRPSEAAGMLAANLPETRQIIWGSLDEDVRNQSLQYLNDDVCGQFLETMNTAQLVAVRRSWTPTNFQTYCSNYLEGSHVRFWKNSIAEIEPAWTPYFPTQRIAPVA